MWGWVCWGLALLAVLVWLFLDILPRIQLARQELRIRQELTSAGRFLECGEVSEQLRQGHGTFIVQHIGPKGPIREWWTPDDLPRAAPVALPDSLQAVTQLEDLHAINKYARECLKAYLDVRTGGASLTDGPVPETKRRDPRKFVTVDTGGGWVTAVRLMTGRALAARYPAARFVTIVCWTTEPVIAMGDAETVFLPPHNAEGRSG